MLLGKYVGLRARAIEDVPILHAELYNDVPGRARSSLTPWTPIPLGEDAPHASRPLTQDAASFSVVELATGELAGAAILARIDLHNRSAHVGLTLRPAFRARGLGTDTVRVSNRYGFRTRGLRRLQLETLAGNDAMVQSALRAGYRREGTLRSASWVDGVFLDEAVFGLLIDEWDDSEQ